ncbi:hypothetical protein PF003_g26535 [Phytophthora fragariae]|nr:hypothetical protein PF003_g26535 [Phytophthora fragariae]
MAAMAVTVATMTIPQTPAATETRTVTMVADDVDDDNP